jgi:transposase
MLLGGFIPEAYIYPKSNRNIRDLIRYRVQLVRKRAEEYVDLHMLSTRHGWKAISRNEIKDFGDDDLKHIFQNEHLLVHAKQDLERIALLTSQIEMVEQNIIAAAEEIESTSFCKFMGRPIKFSKS